MSTTKKENPAPSIVEKSSVLRTSGEKKDTQLQNNAKTSSSRRAIIKRRSLVGMACCAFAGYMLLSERGSNAIYAVTGLYPGEKCSGNGVYTQNHCLCDVGFGGSSCNLVEKYVQSTGDRSKSALLVVSSFDQINAENENDDLSEAYPSLANDLVKDGYDVTVLYTGSHGSHRFGKAQRKWNAKGIKLVELPSFGMTLGNGHSPVTETSYRVYQYIRSQPNFGLVQFNAANGVGFFTLQAQRQGVLCFNTKFIVAVDEAPKKLYDKIAAENPDFIPTDVESLKTYHLEKKSVELADLVVSSSASLLKAAADQGWSVLSRKSIVTAQTDEIEIGNTVADRVTDVKEIVFVGSLDIPSGLNQFLASLDLSARDITNSGLVVTFLGRPSTVNELPSEDYIQSRGRAWDFSWSIHDEIESVDAIVAYLKSHQAIAVLPSLISGSPYLASRIIQAQVPILTTSESAREILHEEDARNAVVTKEYLSVALGRVIAKKSAPVPRVDISRVKSRSAIYAGLSSEPASCAAPASKLPSVSVVLVTHNRPELLQQAIASLESQTYRDFDVVLVDDGSTDPATITMLNELAWKWWEEKGWKVLREPNRYLGAARNTGAKHAKGKYILFMDDDDIAKPNQIEVMLRVATTTGANVVTTGHDTFTSMRTPNSRSTLGRFIPLGGDTLAGMLENVFGDASMLVEKSSFTEIGGFTEEVGVGFEDYEFLAAAALKGYKLEAIPEALHWYRRHPKSMSDNTNLKSNQLRFLRAYAQAESGASGASKEQIELLRATRHKFFERGSEIAFSASNDTIPIYDTNVPDAPTTNVTYPDPTQIDPNGNYTEVIPPYVDAPSDSCPNSAMIYSCGQCIFAEDCPGVCPDGQPADWSQIRDCTGQCIAESSLSVVEDCRGQCVPKDSLTYITDCHGQCVPTSTSPMSALDLCNVCDGDGNSCKDCRGVRFGSAQLDACNVCEGDGSTCLALNSISPLISMNDGSITFRITGAGLKGATLIIDGENIAVPNGYQQSEAEVTVTKTFTGLTGGVKKIPVQLSKYSYDTTSVKYVGVYSTDVVISSVSPQAVFYKEPVTLTITGTNLFDASAYGASPVCVFGTDGRWTTPATYVSGGYTCSAPNLDMIDDSTEADLPVRIKFDNHATDFVSVSGQVSVRYWARAPKTQSAYFSNDGQSIVIEFDSPTTANNLEYPTIDMWEDVPCSKYLFTNIKEDKKISGQEYLGQLDTDAWNVAQLTRKGEEKDCIASFVTPTKLLITLAYEFVSSSSAQFAPIPGRRIVVRPGIMVAFGAGHSETQIKLYPNLIQTIAAPSVPPVPKIVIRNPSTIGTCSNLDIDLSESEGTAGRAFAAAVVSFTSSAPDTDADVALTTYLNNLASDVVQNDNRELSISKELLSSRTYNFKIILKNFLNGLAVKTFSVTKYSDDDHPQLQLLAPPNRAVSPINGQVSVRPDDDVSITAFYGNPCNFDRELIYEWSSTGPTSVTIPEDQVNSDTLYFEGYTLVPGKFYEFTVKAYYTYFEDSAVTLKLSVFVQPGDVKVDVGGDRSVAASNALTLTAAFTDNSYPELQQPSNIYDIRWTCIGSDDSRCVNLTTGRTLVLPSGRKVTLAANTLASKSYKFFAQVYNKNLKSSGLSSPVSISVVNQKVPSVSVSVTDKNPSAFSTKFALQAVVDTSSIVSKSSNLVYKWESVIKIPNNPTFFSTIALNARTLNVNPGTPFLSFKPDQLTHGSSYAMKLTVRDPSLGEGSLPGVAYATFTVRNRPSNGVCSVVGPVIGEELNFANKFGWKCSGWVTDTASMPLSYTVESKLSTDNTWTLISSGETTPSWSNPMPRGSHNIRVTVLDAVGARNAVPFVFNIQVNPSADTIGSQLAYLNAGLSMMSAKSQLVVLGISSTFGSVQQSMQLRRRSTVEEGIQSKQLELLANVLDRGIGVDVQKVGPMLSSILLSISGKTGVPASLVNTAFDLYQRIVSKISSGSEKINTCVSESVSVQLVAIADSLMNTVKQNGMTDTSVTKYLETTMSELERCITRTLTCGAAPLIASGNAISREIGIIDPSRSTNFCGFTTSDLTSAMDPNSLNQVGCVAYSCGTVDSETVLTVTTAVTANQIGSQLVNLEFRKTGSTQDVIDTDYIGQGINADGEFEFVVQSTKEYFDRFNLAAYDVSEGAYNDPSSNPYGPVCAYYVFASGSNGSYEGGTWSTSGVRVVKVDGAAYRVTCRSSHLTTFALLSAKNLNSVPEPTTTGTVPTETAGTTNDEKENAGLGTGAIAGIAAGVGCLALVAVGAAYFRYRSRSAGGVVTPAPALTMAAAGGNEGDQNPMWAEPRTAPAYAHPPTFDEHTAAR